MSQRSVTPAARAPSSLPPLPQVGEGGIVPSPALREGARERAAPLARKRITLQRAKKLRSDQTDAEAKLWYHLRAHRFLGIKFKRQKPVGPYIVDFICDEHRLVIELDGGQHIERQSYDERRSQFLNSQGLRILRFWNDDVLRDTDAVLEAIRLALGEQPSPTAPRPSPLTPLPQAGEGNP